MNTCRKCGAPCRCKWCKACVLTVKRDRSMARYKAGLRTRYSYACQSCGRTFVTTRKSAPVCQTCSRKRPPSPRKSISPYIYSGRDYRVSTLKHRVIVQGIIGRKLETNEVIHHKDLDPSNNSIDNLVVLSRGNHASLHARINLAWAISGEKNLGNWPIILSEVTEAWIRSTAA